MFNLIKAMFKGEDGYITDFDKIILYLKGNNITKENINKILYEILKHNIEIYKSLEKENITLKELNELQSNSNIAINMLDLIEQHGKDTHTSDFSASEDNVDISYYLSEIDNGSDIEKSLPSFYNPDFNSIINKLILHFMKEKIEINKLKADKDIDIEEWNNYIKNEINSKQNIIDTIINYRNNLLTNAPKEEIQSKEKIILFDDETLENDLSKLKKEHYDDFFCLLNSLKENTLKGVKRFNAIGSKKAISEVRCNGARMLFDLIDQDTYMVYYIFEKKDTDSLYHTTLINRANYYYTKKQAMLENFYVEEKKEDFLIRNQELDNQITSKLSSSRKELK